MPFITVDGPSLELDRKRSLVRALTEAASKVYGIPEEAFSVLIREASPENVGLGGKLLADKLRETK